MDAALNPDTVDERRGGWGRLLALFRLIHKGHQRGSSRRGAASYSIGTTLPRGTDNKGCRPRTVLHHRRAPKKLCARNAASASCCSHRVEHSHRAGPRVRRLVWGFSCQAVVFWVLLTVLCSERERPFFVPSPRSGSWSARKGSRDRNASAAWRRVALASLVFRSALTPEHAEGR